MKMDTELSSAPALTDLEPEQGNFAADFVEALQRPQPRISPKYLYDRRGSELFDQICELEEYFPTRTELRIMRDNHQAIASAIGPRQRIVEFGSGSGLKTRILLENLDRPAAYLPVEISRECLLKSASRLAQSFPEIEILPVCADYTQELSLPASASVADGTTIYFPGSTIGNFEPSEAAQFLRRIRDCCGHGCKLVIGVALQTDPELLRKAYNDSRGVTAAFNRNLLWRAKRELDAQVDPDAFDHQAVYDEAEGRIEMRLVSAGPQSIEVKGQRRHFAPGSYITTEYSHKFTVEGFATLAQQAGWQQRDVWMDRQQRFSIQYFES